MVSRFAKVWVAKLKSLVDHQQSVKYKSTTIKTLWPARTVTFSKGRWTGAYCNGLTIMGKLGCPIKKKKSVTYSYAFFHYNAVSLSWNVFTLNVSVLLIVSNCKKTQKMICRICQRVHFVLSAAIPLWLHMIEFFFCQKTFL